MPRRRRTRRRWRGFAENAFAYGTGYLVPLANLGEARYWLPDPIGAVLIVNEGDVTDVLVIVEVVSNLRGVQSMRYVTKTHRGIVRANGGSPDDHEEHRLGFLPAVIAYTGAIARTTVRSTAAACLSAWRTP